MNDTQACSLKQDGFAIIKYAATNATEYVRLIIYNYLLSKLSPPLPLSTSWEVLVSTYPSDNDLHRLISSKSSRTLSLRQASHVTSLLAPFLDSTFPSYCLTDEEGIGHPAIYWRLVRPSCKSDVGPLHADSWFWELNPLWTKNYPDCIRYKLWMPVEAKYPFNGLLVSPKTHISKHYTYTSVWADGKLKPCITKNIEMDDLILINAEPGDIVIFDDKLIHGGAINTYIHPRISYEFTIAIPRHE